MIGGGRPPSNLAARRHSVTVLSGAYHSLRNVKLAPMDMESIGPQSIQTISENPNEPPNQVAKPLIKLLAPQAINRQSQLQPMTSKLPPLRKSSASPAPQIPASNSQDKMTAFPKAFHSNPVKGLAPLPNERISLNKPQYLGSSDILGDISSVEEAAYEQGIAVLHSCPVMIAQRPVTPPPSFTEAEMPGVISLTSRKRYSTASDIPKLPVLPPISDPTFDEIFKKKVNICSYIYDFTDTTKFQEERDLKSRALCEIVQLFEQSIDVKQLKPNLQTALFLMLEKNIFQQGPFVPDVVLSFNYTAICVENSWPHLFYCFQILNRFSQLFPDSPHLNIDTAKKAINLLSIPDNNERLQLLAFLRSYYDLHVDDRKEILAETQRKLTDYMDRQLPPYCVPPLLVLTAHIFTRNGKNLTKEFLSYLEQTVFPIIKSPHFIIFGQHYLQLINSVFVEGSIATTVFFKYLLREWNSTDPQTMVNHIDLLHYILPKVPNDVFSQYNKTIFKYFTRALLSPNIKIVLAALNIWFKPKLDQWLCDSSKIAILTMYDNMKKISESHWSKMIREKASQALSEMGKLDRNSFLKMRNSKQTSDYRKKRYEMEHHAMKNWVHIAKDIEEPWFNLQEKVLEIKNVFDFKLQEQQEKSIISLTFEKIK